MRWIAGLFVLALVLLPTLASAQEVPPVPRTRIDRGTVENRVDGEPSQQITSEQNARQTNSAPTTAGQQAAAPTDPSVAGQPVTGQPVANQPVAGPPQPVTLSAKLSDNGAIVQTGLVWRIFGTQTDETGQLPLLVKSEDAVPTFGLPQGEYLVHVAFGRSQSSDTLIVEPGPNNITILLEAGALRLRSAVSNEISIPSSQLRFDIFTSAFEGGRVPVALDIEEGSLIHLNAGIYNVVSKWGDVNATVRADLRVEPAQLTEATLFHRAAQITFKLASNTGGEAIADVDWTVTDSSGEMLFSALGAFPTTILAEGDYTVLAQLGDDVFNRDFQVRAGPPREVEVLTTVY